MNNIYETESGERLSFYKLFKEKGYHIEIPIIQRDYAQGRDSSSDVREAFLDALYKYLEEGILNRDLDFVYGKLSGDNMDRFIPLDGQQRLTTLFLLHWYLANLSSDNIEKLREVLCEDNKSKFTYETRTSSREFCDALVAKNIDLTQLLPPDDGVNNPVSKTIKDSSWYYLSWENDLTIQSMLTMLDAIHYKFKDHPEFYDRLVDTENPVITFLFLNLKEFNLTDDLYLKMNSRGKPLTGFENFKAKFEQYIDGNDWDDVSYSISDDNSKTKAYTVKEYFSLKIDTVWSDLFWKLNYEKPFDTELMNMIRILFSSQYSLTHSSAKDQNLEFLLGSNVARGMADYTDDFSFLLFERLESLSQDGVLLLINSLDCLTNISKTDFSSPYFDQKHILENVLKNNLTAFDRVQFYAFVRYLIYNKDDIDGLHDWLRIVHNLSQNREFDTSHDTARGIRELEKMIPFSKDILNKLKEEIKIDFFTGVQIREEFLKSHLMLKSENWRRLIESTELQDYFQGQIGFVFEFAEIQDYFNDNGNCDWSDEENTQFEIQFEKYSSKSIAAFKYYTPNENTNCSWERAVLSKGDYLLPTTSERYNLLNANSRDYSWKRFLRYEVNNLEEYKENVTLVKEVLDDDLFDIKNVKSSLEKICDRALINKDLEWRRYFIENPNLINYCKQGFIRYLDNGNDIVLYNASQANHKQRELRTYDLFLNNEETWKLISPFEYIKHNEVKSGADDSHIYLGNYIYDRRHYYLWIGFSEMKYELYFGKEKGEEKKSEFSPKLKAMLKRMNFTWDESSRDEKYWYVTVKEDSILKTLELILNNLKLLK